MKLFGSPDIEKLKSQKNLKGLAKILIQNKDPKLRVAAADALGQLGGKDEAPVLIVALEDSDSIVCKAAAEALAHIGEPATLPLVASMRTRTEDVRKQISRILVAIGAPAVEWLAKVLEGNDRGLRLAAAEVLCQIGEPAIAALTAMLENKYTEYSVRLTVTEVLDNIRRPSYVGGDKKSLISAMETVAKHSREADGIRPPDQGKLEIDHAIKQETRNQSIRSSALPPMLSNEATLDHRQKQEIEISDPVLKAASTTRPQTTRWENVRIFISSTFDDMHAERDYLIKQVFPKLCEWCEKRKLRLVDIDLRWGVKEEDTLNKRVVEVCLRSIDEARPFFLCFLGQRLGWVPKEEEISPKTKEKFPGLDEYIGNTSVTEMEILHALVNPFRTSRTKGEQPAEYYEPAKYALFYLRDRSYLDQLPRDFPPLRKVYTNAGCKDDDTRQKADQELEKLVKILIPELYTIHGRPIRHYKARWNPSATSPELLLPLTCSSTVPMIIGDWQKKWEWKDDQGNDIGVKISGGTIDEPKMVELANKFNHCRSTGRLTGFMCGEKPLSQIIIEDLKAAISECYPEHIEIGAVSDLQKELDQQEQFLYTAGEGFIERSGDFDALDAYAEDDSRQLFVLTAPGGMGKSTLLAKWVDRYHMQIDDRTSQSLHYRFIGQSDRSTTVHSVLHLLLCELKEVVGKLSDEIPDDPQKLRQELPKLLEAVGKQGKTIIVLDAIDQLEAGLSDLTWLPYRLPKNIKLIVSFKRGEKNAEELLNSMQGQVIYSEVRPFVKLEQRKELVSEYLNQFFKQLDPPLLDALVGLPSASNPLYLKVVLSELRVFGAFANLDAKIRDDFGDSPVSAFNSVLARLESDPAYTSIAPQEAVPLLFGLLAHARHGLSVDELTALFIQTRKVGDTKLERDAATDTIHFFLRQVRSFLARRDGRYDFFFESFKAAALQHYVTDDQSASLPQRLASDWHRLLADYFASLPTWQTGPLPQKQPASRKVAELPYHQAWGGEGSELIKTLTDFDFLQAKALGSGSQLLIADFELLFVKPLKTSQSVAQAQEELKLIQETLQLSAHVLEQDAMQLAGQLLGRLTGEGTPRIQNLLEHAKHRLGTPWLRPLVPSLASPGGPFLKTLQGHTAGIESLTILPDKQRVISVGDDDTVRAWNLETGDKLWEWYGPARTDYQLLVAQDGKKAVISSYSASDAGTKVFDVDSGLLHKSLPGYVKTVLPDGQSIVLGERDYLSIWDLAKGREMVRISDVTRVGDAEASADGTRLVFTTYNPKIAVGSFEIWDLEARTCLWQMRSPLIEPLIAVTPDKLNVVAILNDPDERGYLVEMRDLATGSSLWRVSGYSGARQILMSPTGHQLLILPYDKSDKTIIVFDLEQGREAYRLVGHPHLVGHLAIAQDGSFVVSVSEAMSDPSYRGFTPYKDNVTTFKIWNLEKGVQINSWKYQGREDVHVLAVSPDFKQLIFGQGQTLWVRSLQGDKEVCLSRGHRVRIIQITQNGSCLITGGGDGTLRTWDLKRVGQVTQKAHEAPIMQIVTTPDSRQAFSLSIDGLLKMWDLRQVQQCVIPTECREGVTAIAIDPNSKWAIVGQKSGELHLFELERGMLLRTIEGGEGTVVALAVTPDSQQVVSVNTNHGGELRVFNLGNGDVIRSWRGNYAWLSQVLLTPDGRYAVGGQWNVPSIWDLKLGSEAGKLQGDGMNVTAWALTPDGRHVVLAARGIYNSKPLNGVLRLHNLERGKVIFTLGAHTHEVYALIITPDGKCAISASSDEHFQGKGTIKFWNLDTGEELPNPGRPDADIAVMMITPDGRRIISGSGYGDGILEVWDINTGQTIASFQVEGGLTTGALSADGLTFIAGDDTGAVHFLRLENISPTPSVITALRSLARGGLRLLRRAEQLQPTFRCPLCGRWSEIDDASLGCEVSCPNCDTRLRLNPFTIASDWKPPFQ